MLSADAHFQFHKESYGMPRADRRRIFGLETEVLPQYFKREKNGELTFFETINDRLAEKGSIADLLVELIGRKYGRFHRDEKNKGVFMPGNECYFYPDQEHLEFATPECLTPEQLVAYHIWARRVAVCAIGQVNERIGSTEIITALHNSGEPFDRHVESIRDSRYTRGAHENYSVPFPFTLDSNESKISYWLDKYGDALGSFLITRQLVCGNGAAWFEGRESRYMLSQRSKFITHLRGTGATTSRPLLHERHSSYAHDAMIRLHLIVGDANLSEWSIFLKFALTSVVISMITDGFLTGERLDKVNIIGNKIWALHRACEDISGKKGHLLVRSRRDGKKISSLEHQVRFLGLMKAYGAHVTLFPWEKRAIEMYEYILDCIARGDREALADKLDYAIKERLLRRFMQKRNIVSFADPRVLMWDTQYHELHPTRGLFLKIEKSNALKRVISEEDIVLAGKHPPASRALWRNIIEKEMLKAYERTTGRKGEAIKTWEDVHIAYVYLQCLDPFADDLDVILAYQRKRLAGLTREQYDIGMAVFSDPEAEGKNLMIRERPTLVP